MFNSSVGVRKVISKKLKNQKKLKTLKNQKNIFTCFFCFLQWQYIDYITLTPLVALNLPLHLVSPCGHVLLHKKKIRKWKISKNIYIYLFLLYACLCLFVFVMLFSNSEDDLSLHLLWFGEWLLYAKAFVICFGFNMHKLWLLEFHVHFTIVD